MASQLSFKSLGARFLSLTVLFSTSSHPTTFAMDICRIWEDTVLTRTQRGTDGIPFIQNKIIARPYHNQIWSVGWGQEIITWITPPPARSSGPFAEQQQGHIPQTHRFRTRDRFRHILEYDLGHCSSHYFQRELNPIPLKACLVVYEPRPGVLAHQGRVNDQ